MSKAKCPQIFLSFVLLSFIVASVSAQAARVFSEAKGFPEKVASSDYESWRFSLNNEEYEVKKNGLATRRDASNHVTKFRVRLDRDEEIRGVVYFARHKNDLLVICESTLGDGGRGQMIRFNGSSLRTKWNTNIPGFNLARGLIENDSAYLAAIGFIAKIDLATGRFRWKHDDLYRKYDKSGAFDVFLEPIIDNNLVIFKEDDVLKRGFDHQIHVNKSTGKIVKVILK